VECIIRLTFGDAQGLRKRKQTRRDIFLYEMDQIVPWKALLA
jgi:IS5 family transposase